jgi:outer membrane cobalamin receptor
MKRVVLVLLCCCFASASWAQGTASIQGTVRDATTNDPLPLANVALENAGQGTSTNTDGQFVLTGLSAGAYTLVISYIGYRVFRERISLDPGEERQINAALQPADVQIGEVTVTGERTGEAARSLGVTRLTPEQVQNLPTVLEADVFRSLQLLPGVKASSDFSSGLYIRGGSPDQTLILLDQAPVYNPTHVFGFFSAFNPDAIGDVQLYKGGFPAEYGGRLGAVIDLENKEGSEENTEGSLSLGLLASRASIQGPYAKGTWMLSVRRSTLEPLLAALSGSGVEDLPNGFAFYDINGQITYQMGSRDRLALNVYTGRDQLDYPLFDDASFNVSYGNQVLSADWRHLFSDSFFTRTTATVSRYFSDPVADISGTEFVRDNDVVDMSAKADAVWQPSEVHTLEGGVQLGSFTTNLRNFFDGEQTYSPRIRTLYGSVYLQDTFRPRSDWQIRGGLRMNYYAAGGHVRAAPRLSVEHRLTDWARLQTGYGRYYQYLTLVTTELFSAFDFWLTTDTDVEPSYGDQFLMGIKTQPASNMELDVELYYRTMENLFELDQRITDYTGLPYSETLLFGDGLAYGVEVLLRRPEGRVNGFIGYTLGRTERRFQGFEDGDAFPPKYDRTHDLTAVLNVDFAPGWRATGVFTYATGQAYTQPDAQYQLINPPYTSSTPDVLVSEFNAARLPPYHRFDIGVRRTGSFFGIGRYEAQIQLVNAYGRRNIWFYFFEANEDNTVERNAVPQIPVPLPNLSLTLNF